MTGGFRESRSEPATFGEQPVDPVFQHNLIKVAPKCVPTRWFGSLVEEFSMYPFCVGKPEELEVRIFLLVLLKMSQAVGQFLALTHIMQPFGGNDPQRYPGNHAQCSQRHLCRLKYIRIVFGRAFQ